MDYQYFVAKRNINQQVVSEKIPLITNGCLYFFNARHIYLKLTNIERIYFDYMCENMDYDNRVLLDKNFRLAFNDHVRDISSTKNVYNQKNLRNYEKNLSANKLIIKVIDKPKLYYVNPKYVAKSRDQRRKVLDRLSDLGLTEEIDLRAIINKPIDKFGNCSE